MGNLFSRSDSGEITQPRLTSAQPIGDPAPQPPPPATAAAAADDFAMYRHRYRGYRPSYTFNPNRSSYYRYARRYPSYSYPRWRPRASERDRRFLTFLNDDRYRNRDLNRIHRPSDEIEASQPEVPVAEVATRLHVKGVDLHIEDNGRNHVTDMYECTSARTARDGTRKPAELVIRRGQEFTLTINFDRPYDVKKNDISLTFNLGDDYKPKKSMNATFKVDETGSKKYKPKKWGASLVSQKGNSLTVSVFAPASIPVGEWEFSVKTIVDVKDGKDLIWQYNHNEDINILFNPFCEEDWVYMEDKSWLQEVVLNDKGSQYYGTYTKMGARSWFFGQFEDGILDAAFHLVRKGYGYRTTPDMGNAASVSRIISQIVNAPDDDGVLMGNWSGNYEGGTRPTKWNGSVKILRQYMDTAKPVKYGQCWVFSGVVTAVCRALGLPCRSITNFASAHNTDTDRLSIDVLMKVDEDDNETNLSDDSVWNFHVWNEVWMSRPDLSDSKEWDGWQVIDATPQEYSDGVYCCGPAPVKAIKEGEINVGKDAAFIFSEVNADRVEFKEDPCSGVMVEISRRTSSVGKNISTHMPTGRAYRGASMRRRGVESESENLERLDVTDEYKYKEGSEKERSIVKKAERMFLLAHCGFEHDDEEELDVLPLEDIEIEIEEMDDIFVGNGFEFTVHVKNKGKEDACFKDITLRVLYKTYHDTCQGVAALRKVKDIQLGPNQTETLTIEVDKDRATAYPNLGFNFELRAIATFFHTYNVVSESELFRLRRPDIEVKGPETCRLSDVIKVELTFTNPLDVVLTECEIDIEGGLECVDPDKDTFPVPDIQPKGSWSRTLSMKPQRHPRGSKDRDISIGFDSKQLSDIIGYYAVEIKS
ncbi:annulin-like isoform X1 [Haliotis cracherodii]|uniref:annulin-like isoform X1 n=2 Tax=Haliotis cracherodii TaxID=6455 RepID=UPI0039EAB7EE